MINAQQAFSLFKEINSTAVVDVHSVYFTALGAERWGHITIPEMNAIAIYHKEEIVSLWDEEQAYVEWEAAEMSAVHKAQSDYWTDYEAGLYERPEGCYESA